MSLLVSRSQTSVTRVAWLLPGWIRLYSTGYNKTGGAAGPGQGQHPLALPVLLAPQLPAELSTRAAIAQYSGLGGRGGNKPAGREDAEQELPHLQPVDARQGEPAHHHTVSPVARRGVPESKALDLLNIDRSLCQQDVQTPLLLHAAEPDLTSA